MKLSLPRAPAPLDTHRTMERTHQDMSSAAARAAVMDRLRVARESEPARTTSMTSAVNGRAAVGVVTTAQNAGSEQQQHWLLQQQQQQQQYGRSDANGITDQPRSVLARVLGTASDQPPVVNNGTRGIYMNGGGGVYGRLSEPTHSTGGDDSRGLEADAALRRSLPSTHRGDVAQDMNWALQSIQEQSRGRDSSSSGRPQHLMPSSSSAMYVARNQRQLMASAATGANAANRPAYQLSRAHSADVMQQRALAEPFDEVAQLRQMIAALQRNLAEESKRRATDSKQYESRIFELQTLIRRNMPEQRRELERSVHSKDPALALQQAPLVTAACPTRTPQQQSVPPATSRGRALRGNQNAAVPGPYVAMRQLSEMEREELDQNGDLVDEDDDNDEDPDPEDDPRDQQDNQRNSELPAVRQVKARMKQQLTALRARMRTEVAHAAGEVTVLSQRLEEERNEHARKERRLQERVVFLEERRRHAKQKLQTKIALLNTEIVDLKDENQRLQDDLQLRDRRIQQLELAVGGRNLVAAYQKTNSATPTTTTTPNADHNTPPHRPLS